MIIEAIMSVYFFMINGIISNIPSVAVLPSWLSSTINLVMKGLAFFPSDVWNIVITNICFWLTVHMTWAIVEWCYKKIPGVD